jgi:hypothetical protein
MQMIKSCSHGITVCRDNATATWLEPICTKTNAHDCADSALNRSLCMALAFENIYLLTRKALHTGCRRPVCLQRNVGTARNTYRCQPLSPCTSTIGRAMKAARLSLQNSTRPWQPGMTCQPPAARPRGNLDATQPIPNSQLIATWAVQPTRALTALTQLSGGKDHTCGTHVCSTCCP